jgi:hypothetical protein
MASKILGVVGAAMMATGLLGCSVHSQAPIRQVAYDFSDHAYYDRDFAPSPNYADAQGYYGQAWVTPVAHQHVHVDASCGCSHGQPSHAGHAAPSSHDGYAEGAADPRRPARPQVDFDRDRNAASGRVDERAPQAAASDDSSRSRPRFTGARPASEGEGRAEPAARPTRPAASRPEATRPTEARGSAPAAGRPMVAPEGRRGMKSPGDDRIARR